MRMRTRHVKYRQYRPTVRLAVDMDIHKYIHRYIHGYYASAPANLSYSQYWSKLAMALVVLNEAKGQ